VKYRTEHLVVRILIRERKYWCKLGVPFGISGLFFGKMELYFENKNVA